MELGPVQGLPDRTIPALEAERRHAERRRILTAVGCAIGVIVPVAGLIVWVT